MKKSLYSITIRVCLFIAFLSCVYTIYAGIDPIYSLSLTQRFLCASLFVLPMGVSCYLICRNMKTEEQQLKVARIFWIILFIYYLAQLFYMLYFASEFSRTTIFEGSYWQALTQQWDMRTNMIPFETIQLMLNAYHYQYNNLATLNLLGNIVAFMPFAFFLPKLFPSMQKTRRFLSFMAILIIMVEIMQLFTLTGTMDIDDFILNMFGVIFLHIILKIPVCQHTFLLNRKVEKL